MQHGDFSGRLTPFETSLKRKSPPASDSSSHSRTPKSYKPRQLRCCRSRKCILSPSKTSSPLCVMTSLLLMRLPHQSRPSSPPASINASFKMKQTESPRPADKTAPLPMSAVSTRNTSTLGQKSLSVFLPSTANSKSARTPRCSVRRRLRRTQTRWQPFFSKSTRQSKQSQHLKRGKSFGLKLRAQNDSHSAASSDPSQ